MKKLNYFFLTMLCLLWVVNLSAQEILQVSPGDGTLNAAIAEHGGSRIYQLQAGQWYGLNEIIQNDGYHLQIIGEPYDDETLPATVQTGTLGDGTVFARMFDALGPVTLKNLYIMNSDINGQIPNAFFRQNDSAARVVIDHCIIDPAAKNTAISLTGGVGRLFFTNNLLLRHGNMATQNDANTFNAGSPVETTLAWDTLWVENNTFVSTGMVFIFGGQGTRFNNVIVVNHNTFVLHKSQIDWMNFENEFYWTNNLMFEFMTNPYAHHWQPMPGADLLYPKPALIYADTMPGETLPSTRIEYLQYNNSFKSQKFYDLIAEANTLHETTRCQMQPLFWKPGMPDKWGQIWPDSAYKMCRESHLFNYDGPEGTNVNTDFPLWQEGNNNFYAPDPLFNDPVIYQYSDSLRNWQYYSTRVNVMKFLATDYPPVSEWAMWHWEPDGDVAINDAWPVFDGTYTEPSTLTGSIEGLPLGDLNWFPDKKALWEAEKDDIFAHMKSGNTGHYSLTSVPPVVAGKAPLSKIYPNPLSLTATIEFTLDKSVDVEIAVFNTVGQQVKVLLNETRNAGTHTVTLDRRDLNNGLYFYTITAGNRSETHKIVIM